MKKYSVIIVDPKDLKSIQQFEEYMNNNRRTIEMATATADRVIYVVSRIEYNG